MLLYKYGFLLNKMKYFLMALSQQMVDFDEK